MAVAEQALDGVDVHAGFQRLVAKQWRRVWMPPARPRPARSRAAQYMRCAVWIAIGPVPDGLGNNQLRGRHKRQ